MRPLRAVFAGLLRGELTSSELERTLKSGVVCNNSLFVKA